MVVVLIMAGVWLLLQIGPATDILQALRGVPNLDEAGGLQGVGREGGEGWVSGRLFGG